MAKEKEDDKPEVDGDSEETQDVDLNEIPGDDLPGQIHTESLDDEKERRKKKEIRD